MGLGQMNGFADIVKTKQVKDSEGFTHSEDEVLASVRVYREGRHGSERWANLAAFSEATDLFRFRCIPGLTVTTDQFLVCDDSRRRSAYRKRPILCGTMCLPSISMKKRFA